MESAQELALNTGASALRMAYTIFHDDVSIVDARYYGNNASSAIWMGGDSTSSRLTPSDTGVVLSTGFVSDLTNGSGATNQSLDTTGITGGGRDTDFETIAARRTYDASILEVDFIPDNAQMSLQFTFASEEYPEFVGSIFNDQVGIWINGTKVTSPVFTLASINSVSDNSNSTLYIDNASGTYNTEMDGFTTTLRVSFPVSVGAINTLKIGITDVGDPTLDSAILIAGGSIQGMALSADDSLRIAQRATSTLDVLANDSATMAVTQINGQDIRAGETITLASGHQITLLPDGKLSVTAPALPEGDTVIRNFTYTATNSDGITDTAFVTITTVPCFARGTKIRTTEGDIAIEKLRVGMMVETHDDGPQPIRWIGSRKVPAIGNHAPIVIEEGSLGFHGTLVLSPQHRVLVRDIRAQLMFGEEEVLVAAKDLINDVTIYRREGGDVEYFHILFDHHQIITSEGLLTESFYPGKQVLPEFDDAIRAELFDLFPALQDSCGAGYGELVRMPLRSYEARAMMA